MAHLCLGQNRTAPADGEAGHHLMVPAGQEPQHLRRSLLRPGLSQNAPTADHNGVSGNHHILGARRCGHGLGPAHPGHLLSRVLPRLHSFVNVRRPDGKRKSHSLQQLPPPGGLGRQNDLHLECASQPFIPRPAGTAPGCSRRARRGRRSPRPAEPGPPPGDFL